MILTEERLDGVQTITESDKGDKKMYLKGVFMEAESPNRNGRIYKKDEMKREVDRVSAMFEQGNYMLGTLDHEASLEVSLKNVSHKITDLKMEGNQVIGKAEVLEKTQAGGILKGLMESGVKVGVSSRGKGQLNESGQVSNFHLVTIDAVAMPSAHNAYPESIMESLNAYKRGEIVNDLAEAVLYDQNAQKYFLTEMQKFIETMKLR